MWSRPLQPASGSQTSKPILESATGEATPVTRQKGGRPVWSNGLPSMSTASWKAPSWRASARVIVACGSASRASPVHCASLAVWVWLWLWATTEPA